MLWSQLRELAGVSVSDSLRDRISDQITAQYEQKLAALEDEYEARMPN